AAARGRPAPRGVPADARGRCRPGAGERCRGAGGAGERDSLARGAPTLLHPGGGGAPESRRAHELRADARDRREPAVPIRLRDHRYAARAAGDGCGGAREGGRRGRARREGARHSERAGPRGPRSAVDDRRSPPRRRGERRGSELGRPLSVRQLLPTASAGGIRMSLPVVSQSDRKVLLALQGFVVGLPLFLGGRQPWAVAAGSAVILLLLAVTIRERRRRGAAPYPPGIAALVGLVGLALATTLPLPPTVLRLLAPATAAWGSCRRRPAAAGSSGSRECPRGRGACRAPSSTRTTSPPGWGWSSPPPCPTPWR